jgi:capsular polysaccharide biosynthesis protein
MQNILNGYTINRKMPENYVDGELDFCKAEFSYRTYDVKLIELNNCIVNKKGFVYETGKFRLNKYSLLDEKIYRKELSLKHYLKKVLFKHKSVLGNDRYLLAHDDWSSAHYHWFCDVLPRLFVIKDRLKDYHLLLPNSAYVKDIGLKSLDFFDLQPAGITFLEEDELVKIKNLTIITHTCLTGYINDKIMQEMRKFIDLKLAAMQAEDHIKIYITRDHALYRKILNETEVKDIVKDFGYDTVRYEDLSWLDQLKKTASAKSMVSIHGAGLINMLYMRKGGTVLEFRRDKIYHNQCFWHLSQALQLKYYYLFGSPDDENQVIEGNGCNLTIDTAHLSKTLMAMDQI